jgi:hypothetical protein
MYARHCKSAYCANVMTYSAALSLRDNEEEDDGLNSAPDTKDNIGLPGNVSKRNGYTELVGQQACLVNYVSAHLREGRK